MPILTPFFTVVTYDLRGHGESPLPDGEFGLDDLVQDLEYIRQETGFEKAHFAGHSLGGMIGPAYARAYPDHVLSLGLLSTAAFRTPDDCTKVMAVVKAMEDRGIPNMFYAVSRRMFEETWRNVGYVAKHLLQPEA